MDEYNRGLSERRARAVPDYLVESGLDSGIMSTRGYGKSSPRVPGTSALDYGFCDVDGSEARNPLSCRMSLPSFASTELAFPNLNRRHADLVEVEAAPNSLSTRPML